MEFKFLSKCPLHKEEPNIGCSFCRYFFKQKKLAADPEQQRREHNAKVIRDYKLKKD